MRILAIGGHPDDCEFQAGGSALRWKAAGAVVKFVSATDGRTGHFQGTPEALAQRRAAEAKAACDLAGFESEVLDIPNNGLVADLPSREKFIRVIRSFNPDIVITHRLCDYHPDHRYTAQLVQDSAHSVCLPLLLPDVPAMARNPVILFMHDEFTQPTVFRPDLLVDIDAQMDMKTRLLDCHGSQMYEWLSWGGVEGEAPPADAAGRLQWLRKKEDARNCHVADRFRTRLESVYGPRGRSIRCAEAFEISEYGAKLSPEMRAQLECP